MSTQTDAVAQDNTDATVTTQQQDQGTPVENAENKVTANQVEGDQGKQGDKPNPDSGKESAKEGDKAVAPALPKSLIQQATEGDAPASGENGESSDDVYQLEFPEGSVADSEAISVLNTVGKEFNIPADKAQALATAATEYGNRRVEATMDHMRKGYEEFCNTNLEQTKAIYGEKTQEVAKMAARGWDAFLQTQKTPDGKPMRASHILDDPNFAALGNVAWFIAAGNCLAKYHVEGQGIISGKNGERSQQDADINWNVS